MKIATSWHTERDPKIDKINSEYVKKVEFVKDEDGRTRETGEIDFLKLPRREFIKIFENLNLDNEQECRLKHNYDENKYSMGDHRYYDFTEEMFDFGDELRHYFKIHYEADLFKLFKDFVTMVDSKAKYKKFTEVLNSTCKLTYMDFDGYEYSYYSEHPHPMQEDVDHNYIGSFSFVVMKPISINAIRSIKNEVERLSELRTEDQTLEK